MTRHGRIPTGRALAICALSAAAVLAGRPTVATAQPDIGANPVRLIFNDVQGGAASAAKTVMLSNSGDTDLTISALTLSGADAAQFQLSSPPALPATVSAGGVLAVSVVFNPTTTGPKGAALADRQQRFGYTDRLGHIARARHPRARGQQRAVAAMDPRHLADPRQRR